MLVYICLCNGIKEKDMQTAISEAATVGDVYSRLGCRPVCGMCVPEVCERLGCADPDKAGNTQ